MTDKKILNKPEKHLPIQTLSKQEIHHATEERLAIISKEFKDGFNFLERYPKSVTFFGSSHVDENNNYYKQARSLAGKIVRELNYSILSGGGPGIMEAANRGAFENNGQSLGLTIDLPEGQVRNPYVNDHIDFYYFFSRKVCLSFSAEAYIFFPGGFGTFDEVYEILTLIQTHKIEKVPVILVGKDFWMAIEETMKKEMLSRGMIDDSDMELYSITDDEDEIIRIIRETPIQNSVPFDHNKLIDNSEISELSKKRCIPCEGKTKPMEHDESKKLLSHVDQWILIEDKSLEKTYKFKDFVQAIWFVNHVANIAENEKHHPDIRVFDYDKVTITLSTHAIDGLSENDFIMAAKIDEILRD